MIRREWESERLYETVSVRLASMQKTYHQRIRCTIRSSNRQNDVDRRW